MAAYQTSQNKEELPRKPLSLYALPVFFSFNVNFIT